MARILLTGAGGYVGTVLAPMLLAGGHEVRALDRFFFGIELLPPRDGLELVREDLRRLTPGHLAGIDAVVDLAALSNDPSGELFKPETFAINHAARVRCAQLAKAAGVSRYLLPSSCSVYGTQSPDRVCDEACAPNPLTTYARANLQAEADVLPLADEAFCVTVLRQATLFGESPRMRFDLAVNGMTWGAVRNRVLPLMRDGRQWRPLMHVRDAARAIMFFLQAPADEVSGQTVNVGPLDGNWRLAELAEAVRAAVPGQVGIEWYGDPDQRSYRVAFDKLAGLGWQARHSLAEAVAEIAAGIAAGRLERSPRTLTVLWYQELERWRHLLGEVSIDGGLLRLP